MKISLAQQIVAKRAELSRLKPRSERKAKVFAELSALVVRQLKLEMRNAKSAA